MKKRFIFLILGSVVALSGLSTPFIYAALKNENVEKVEVIDSDALTGNITVKASFDKDIKDAKSFTIESRSGKKIKSQNCFKTDTSFFKSTYNIYFNDVTLVSETFFISEWKNNKGELRNFLNKKTFDVVFETPFTLKEIKINEDFDYQDSTFTISGLISNPRKYEVSEISCLCNGEKISLESYDTSFSKELATPKGNTVSITFENIYFLRSGEKTSFPISTVFSFDKNSYQTSEIQSLEFDNGVFVEDILYNCTLKVKETKFKNALEIGTLEDGMLKTRKVTLKETLNNVNSYSFVSEAKNNITIAYLKYGDDKTYLTNYSVDVFPKQLVDKNNLSISCSEIQLVSEKYDFGIFIKSTSGRTNFLKVEFSLGPDEHIIAESESGDFSFNKNNGLLSFSETFLNKFSDSGPFSSKNEILVENNSNKVQILFTLERINFDYTTTLLNYNEAGNEIISTEKSNFSIENINLTKQLSIERPISRFQNFITALNSIDDYTWGDRTVEIQCLMSFSHNPYSFKPENWFYKFNSFEDKENDNLTYLPYESYHFSLRPTYEKDSDGLDQYIGTFSIFISSGESIVFKPYINSKYLNEKMYFNAGTADIKKNLESLVDVRRTTAISTDICYKESDNDFKTVHFLNDKMYFEQKMSALYFDIYLSSNTSKSFFNNINSDVSTIYSNFIFEDDEELCLNPFTSIDLDDSLVSFELENNEELPNSPVTKISLSFETMFGEDVSFSVLSGEEPFSPHFEDFSERYGFENGKVNSSDFTVNRQNENILFTNDVLYDDINNGLTTLEKVSFSNGSESISAKFIKLYKEENVKKIQFMVDEFKSLECSEIVFSLNYSNDKKANSISIKLQLDSSITFLEKLEDKLICHRNFDCYDEENKLWKIYIKANGVTSQRSDSFLTLLAPMVKKITVVDEKQQLYKIVADVTNTSENIVYDTSGNFEYHHFVGNTRCTPLTGMHPQAYDYVRLDLKNGETIKVSCSY